MRPHKDYEKYKRISKHLQRLQKLATKHGINDIFQDNGGKILQLKLITGLNISPGREGNDAVDEQGNEYELKSVNINLTKQVSTHHHLNKTIIDKYRSVKWIFAVYKGIELNEVYKLDASMLEPFFLKWEEQYRKTGKEINNPKISLKFVREHGKKYYPFQE